MDMKQLRALVAIAQTRSVTRAAAVLNLVQPAVSRQLKQLEEDVGVPLFERKRHGMELTAAGLSLVAYARRILDEIARARAEIQTGSNTLGGPVTIGLLASTAELLGTRLATSVAGSDPGIRLRIVVGYAGHVQKWLESGELDAALLYDTRKTALLRLKPLLTEALWVVGPASAGLRKNRAVTMRQFASGPVVLPSAPQGLRNAIEEAAAAAGVTLEASVETNDLRLQKSLVMEGLGLTILPAIAVSGEIGAGGLSAAPLKSPRVSRKIVLAWPTVRPPSAAVRRVTDVLEACMQRAIIEGQWPSATWFV